MNNIQQIFDDAVINWGSRENKGVGTALILPPLDDKCMIPGIVERMFNKNEKNTITIVVPTFKDRTDLMKFLCWDNKDNGEFYKTLVSAKLLLIYTKDIVERVIHNLNPNLFIIYHINYFDDIYEEILAKSKFKLVILNNLLKDVEQRNKLYNFAPLLSNFKQAELDELRTNTPVKDMFVGVDIPEGSDDEQLYNDYNEFVATSLSIFGSFDILQQARTGNTQCNVSAMEICSQIAEENGWNDHLDMSIPFNVQIDKLYNPANIRERASRTYDIIRFRTDFLTNYKGKLNKIRTIVDENPSRKILIINKKAEFASIVTDYLNSFSLDPICGNYHDRLEPIPAVDIEGNPIYYKTGAKKGERKMMAAKAQKTLNELKFNKGLINVLSTNNAPDKDLSIDVDIVIITSPLCETIETYMYRLTKTNFNPYLLNLYSMYVKNSMEENRLENRSISENHEIVNKCELSGIVENNSAFIVGY